MMTVKLKQAKGCQSALTSTWNSIDAINIGYNSNHIIYYTLCTLLIVLIVNTNY